MAEYYSPSAGGFFIDGINARIPEDAIALKPGQHAALLQAQAEGKQIGLDARGRVRALAPKASLTDRRTRLLAAVKREAERRILLIAPVWRQLNDLRATGLDLASATVRRERIDAVRAASDALEQAIATMSAAAIATFDVTADDHWPPR